MPAFRRRCALLLAFLLVLRLLQVPQFVVAAAPAPGVQASGAPYQMVIAFDPGTSEAARDAIVAQRGGRTIQRLDSINARLVEFPGNQSPSTSVADVDDAAGVRYAQPNYSYSIDTMPDDPNFINLWGLNNTGQLNIDGVDGVPDADIDAPEAWDITTGNKNVVVGIVDTGILYTHPDLVDNIWTAPAGWNVKGCGAGTHGYRSDPGGTNCDPIDQYGHGTHVAGTIGATGNNGKGVVGVNWHVKLMGLRFFDANGNGTTAGAIEVIDYAVKARQAGVNIRVLNNSWTSSEYDQALLAEIDAANAAGILFVAAAGNHGDNNNTTSVFPANYGAAPYNRPNVIAVAATDHTDSLASFSDFGSTSVHLGAPGVAIYSTVLNNSYDYKSGTSMATPHVVGAAALILSVPAFNNLSVLDLRDRLLNCGDAIPALAGKTITGKRLNVAKAINGTGGCAPAPDPTPVPGITTLSPSFATVGGGQFTLTVNGSNFVQASVVRWNGADQATTYVSATQLTATIAASLIATSGSATVTVFNPVPGGGTSNGVQFAIDQASQTITFGPLVDKNYGAPDFVVSATASSDLTVSFAASGNCTVSGTTVAITGVGSCTITASQAGNDTYGPAPDVPQTFTIAKGDPVITWANPAAIPVSTALDATQLNATANVPGSFAYDPSGTVLPLGANQTLSVTFTPTDTANYNVASASRQITVSEATPAVTWANPVAISYGTSLGATQLNATADIPGTFVYSPTAGTVLGAGSQTLSVTFTPDDSATFGSTTATVALVVNPVPLTVMANDATTAYGAPLPSFSVRYDGFVNGDDPGVLVGTIAFATTVTPAKLVGTYLITPSGLTATNYEISYVPGTLTIEKAAQTIAITPDPLPNRALGDPPVVVSATATSRLTVSLAVGQGGPCTLDGGTITLVAVGTCTVTATQGGDANYLAATPVVRSFEITGTQFTLSLTQASGGTAVANPGPGLHPAGTQVTLTATPDTGQLFTGWWVDGVLRSYANPAHLTLSGNRAVAPSFALKTTFSDVPQGGAAYEAITQLASRGVIRGYAAAGCAALHVASPCFGPNDQVTRAQMAALIARAMGWDQEDWGNPFTDSGGIDPNLWRNVGTLAHYGVAFGYGNGTFGPNDKVTYAQTISFISRAMVVKGFWQARTAPPDPVPFGGVLSGTGHQNDVATFLFYTAGFGGVPDHPAGGGFADWNTPSSRGWFSRTLWTALQSQYSDGEIP